MELNPFMKDTICFHQSIALKPWPVATPSPKLKTNSLVEQIIPYTKCIGDPLDVKMFEAIQWTLEEKEYMDQDALVIATLRPRIKDDLESSLPPIGVIRRFEFASKLQRMSVVVRNIGEKVYKMHIKGSPEKVRELCRPESIPSDFHEVLSKYTQVKFYSYLLIIIGRIQSSCLRYKNP